MILLSSAYFPNVHYFARIAHHNSIQIEACEHFQKQSYRNRCDISAANGIISLTVPVIKGRSQGLPIKEAKIGYDTPWQKIHFKSIESAYRHAPFYEYYIDDLLFVWEKRHTFLFDLNHAILDTLLELCGYQDILIEETEEFQPPRNHQNDWRFCIHPKVPYAIDPEFHPKIYQQNFEQKKGFQANLSILDTLFQLGPETLKYVNDCVVSRT